MSQVQVTMRVNGEAVARAVSTRTLLVEFLRYDLGLTGTHVGCDTSQCGACNVHVDGECVKSCTMLAVQAEGADVTTIEGVAKGEELHPMQAAFKEHHALQCGFCTPGMVMCALDLVKRNGKPERGGDSCLSGGQFLPLHGLPQHRQGHRRRRRGDGGLGEPAPDCPVHGGRQVV